MMDAPSTLKEIEYALMFQALMAWAFKPTMAISGLDTLIFYLLLLKNSTEEKRWFASIHWLQLAAEGQM
jgi:hypothetical protein